MSKGYFLARHRMKTITRTLTSSVMALALGWFSLLLPIFALGLSFLIAGIVAIWLLLRKRIKLGGSMALGPYLIAGFLGAVTLAVWS